MIDEATIHARITQLEAERDAYIVQANATIQAYTAAIGELRRLVAPVDVPQATEYIEQTQESQ